MDLPTLPTDNLYKFLALGGLVLLVASFAFPLIRISDIQVKLIEARRDGELLKVETASFEKELDRVGQRPKVSSADAAWYRTRLLDLRIKEIQWSSRQEQIDQLTKELLFAQSFLGLGCGIGTVLSAVGFALWYRRVQKPNDLLLKRQLEKEVEQ